MQTPLYKQIYTSQLGLELHIYSSEGRCGSEGHPHATLMEPGSGSLMSDPDPRRGGWRVQDHGPPGGSLPGLLPKST